MNYYVHFQKVINIFNEVLSFDYKYKHSKCSPDSRRGSHKDHFYYDIRLSLAYQKSPFNKITMEQGDNMWYFTLGTGFNYFGTKTVKYKD